MRDVTNGGNVDDFEGRIGQRFKEYKLRVIAYRCTPCIKVTAINQRHLDPETRKDRVNNVKTRAEQCTRGHHVIPRLETAH